eukprot:9759115-Ditylum_brightwellii.AAC.2
MKQNRTEQYRTEKTRRSIAWRELGCVDGMEVGMLDIMELGCDDGMKLGMADSRDLCCTGL